MCVASDYIQLNLKYDKAVGGKKEKHSHIIVSRKPKIWNKMHLKFD